ncbi:MULTISPECIES: energy transducer TonB [unclassified Nitrospina]|uniref:energy transducer TonB n=1 Tax=unclassified Nitrospina TaxID=2638683 RepID=UPI003F9E88A1
MSLMNYIPPLPVQPALAQSHGWKAPAGDRHADAVQPTHTIAGIKPTTQTGQRHFSHEKTTEIFDKKTFLDIPTASWTGPKTGSKKPPKGTVRENGSGKAPPSVEQPDTINSENIESASHQFASKGFTSSHSGGEDLEALKNGFILEIRNRIAKYKFYPRLARRRGLEGKPVVHFRVTRRGTVQDLHVALSSGSGILDEAALESVKKGAPFPVIPHALNRDSMTIQLPIAFTLD